MIRKILSSILTFCLLCILTTLGCLLVARSFLVGENKTIFYTTLFHITEEEKNIKEVVFKKSFKETGIPENLIDYMEEKDTNKYINNYLEQYIKYQLNQVSYPKMNNKELQTLLNNAIEKYEKETKKKINTTTFYQVLDELDNKEKKEKTFSQLYPKASSLAESIYNKESIFLFITLYVICAFLLLLLNRFREVIKYFSTMFLINGISLKIMAIVLENEMKKNNLVELLVNNMNKEFSKYAYISFLIGLLLLASILLTYLIKEMKQKNKE